MGGYTANAADTTTGSGSGVAYGTGSDAPKAENVAIGKGAVFPIRVVSGCHPQGIL